MINLDNNIGVGRVIFGLLYIYWPSQKLRNGVTKFFCDCDCAVALCFWLPSTGNSELPCLSHLLLTAYDFCGNCNVLLLKKKTVDWTTTNPDQFFHML